MRQEKGERGIAESKGSPSPYFHESLICSRSYSKFVTEPDLEFRPSYSGLEVNIVITSTAHTF